jgi:hypothetical protein
MLIILSEDKYLNTINSYDKAHWQPLLDLIPDIEATKKFVEIVDREDKIEGVIQMPYFKVSEIVYKFHTLVDELGIMISFDWGSWQEGKDILEGKAIDFDRVDIPTKCKLISMIIRNDRFCDGYLVSTFEKGIILGMLKSIERQLG